LRAPRQPAGTIGPRDIELVEAGDARVPNDTLALLTLGAIRRTRGGTGGTGMLESQIWNGSRWLGPLLTSGGRKNEDLEDVTACIGLVVGEYVLDDEHLGSASRGTRRYRAAMATRTPRPTSWPASPPTSPRASAAGGAACRSRHDRGHARPPPLTTQVMLGPLERGVSRVRSRHRLIGDVDIQLNAVSGASDESGGWSGRLLRRGAPGGQASSMLIVKLPVWL
jgi:hypothetical protein